MDYSSDDISFTDFDFEPQKKKKKKNHMLNQMINIIDLKISMKKNT